MEDLHQNPTITLNVRDRGPGVKLLVMEDRMLCKAARRRSHVQSLPTNAWILSVAVRISSKAVA